MAIPWTEYEMEKDLLDLSDYVEDPDRITPKTNLMKSVGPSLWIVPGDKAHQYRRMVICGLQCGGGSWLWSPMLPPTDELCAEIEVRSGGVRHIICPSPYHHSYLEAWSTRYPKAKIHVAPPGPEGLSDDSNVVVDFIISDDPKRDYVLDIDSVLMRGSSTTEAIFYHRMSNTIIVADLIQEKQGWTEWLLGKSTVDDDGEATTTSGTNPNEKGEDDTAVESESTPDESTGGIKTGETVEQSVASAPSESNQVTNNNNDSTSIHNYHVPKTWQWSFWWNGEMQLARNGLEKILKKWNPDQLILSRGTCLQKGAADVVRNVFAWVPQDSYMMYNDRPDPQTLGGFRRGVFTTGDDHAAPPMDDHVPDENEEDVAVSESSEGAGQDDDTAVIVGPKTPTGMPFPKIPSSNQTLPSSVTAAQPSELHSDS